MFYNNFKWSAIYINFESLCRALEANIVNQLYLNLKKKTGGLPWWCSG